MVLTKGRNRNTNDVASVPAPIAVDKIAATVIVPANPDRISLHITLNPALNNSLAFIRLFPAATRPTERVGIVVGRLLQGNDVFFDHEWVMPVDNIYTGEISAILGSDPIVEDTDTMLITEY